LKGIDDIQQLIDDQLSIVQMMKGSPYITPVLTVATKLEQQLNLVQETLEAWIKCQRSWLYLEPIFSSEDIKRDMGPEKDRFDNVNEKWKNTMETFYREVFISSFDYYIINFNSQEYGISRTWRR